MTKFLKLHEACGNNVFKVVLLNVDCIEHFKIGNKGTDTFVKMLTPSRTEEGKASWFFVRESIEEIERMLHADYSKPPMVVDRKLASQLGLAK